MTVFNEAMDFDTWEVQASNVSSAVPDRSPKWGRKEPNRNFDLMKLDADGKPSHTGEWRCSNHFRRIGSGYQIIGGPPK